MLMSKDYCDEKRVKKGEQLWQDQIWLSEYVI